MQSYLRQDKDTHILHNQRHDLVATAQSPKVLTQLFPNFLV